MDGWEPWQEGKEEHKVYTWCWILWPSHPGCSGWFLEGKFTKGKERQWKHYSADLGRRAPKVQQGRRLGGHDWEAVPSESCCSPHTWLLHLTPTSCLLPLSVILARSSAPSGNLAGIHPVPVAGNWWGKGWEHQETGRAAVLNRSRPELGSGTSLSQLLKSLHPCGSATKCLRHS